MTDASRRVLLDGAPNFRDLGGYETHDGRRVKRGQLFRSGRLSDLTDDDLVVLEEKLGIKTVVDLRSPQEIASHANRLPRGAVAIEVPVTDVSISPRVAATRLQSGDNQGLGPEMLLTGNRAFARELRAAFATMLQLAMDEQHRPMVFHCTAGKDRTGFAAAIVLLALGVPLAAVVDDYLFSNACLEQRHAELLADLGDDFAEVERLRSVLHVRREYLEAGLDTIAEDHGTIDRYLRDALGATEAQLDRFRQALLEGATA